MTPFVIEALRRNGLDRGDRLILQSFDEQTLRTSARDLPSIPRVFLMERTIAERWLKPARLREAAAFVTGIGPAKQIVEARPDVVEMGARCGSDGHSVYVPRRLDRTIRQRRRGNALFPLYAGR